MVGGVSQGVCDFFYLTSFCRMRWWTCGFGSFTPPNSTRSKVHTIIHRRLKLMIMVVIIMSCGLKWFLEVNIFVWRLFLNRLATKNNLFRRHILSNTNVLCLVGCDIVEDRNHLFFQCSFYEQLWYLTSRWLGITFVSQSELQAHSIPFGGLGEFSEKFLYNFYYCLDCGPIHYLEGP